VKEGNWMPVLIDLNGDDAKSFVYIRYAGTAEVPVIYVSKTPLGSHNYPLEDEFDLRGPDPYNSLDGIDLISIVGQYHFRHSRWAHKRQHPSHHVSDRPARFERPPCLSQRDGASAPGASKRQLEVVQRISAWR
jgi:hypothetical protein